MSADATCDQKNRPGEDVAKRLAAIEVRLERIGTQLNAIGRWRGRLEDINANLEAIIEIVAPDSREG